MGTDKFFFIHKSQTIRYFFESYTFYVYTINMHFLEGGLQKQGGVLSV